MSDIAIRVENLSKRYRIGLKEEMHDTLFGAMADFVRQPIKNLRRLRQLSRFEEDGRDSEDIIWALKDVSFEVEQGEVVGIPSTALRRSSGQGSGQASGATGRGRPRCSRSSLISPSPPVAGQRSMAEWLPCWRWALASTPN